jgi:hypothetical protein
VQHCLVGSEMCIRDRCKDEWHEEEAHLGQDRERPKLPD